MFKTTSRIAHGIAQTSQIPIIRQPITPIQVLSKQFAKVKINSDIRKHFIDIREEQRLTILAWANDQAQQSFHHEQSINNLPAREAAHAYRLLQALTSMIDGLEKYDFWLQNAPLLVCIKPHHEEFLRECFKDSFSDLDTHEKIALGAALQPGVMEKMGIKINASLQAEIQKHQATSSMENWLTQSELISLIDYVNSQSGIFNALNDAARAKMNYGEPLFQNLVEPLSTELLSAIVKLSKNPDFALHDILIYKGVNLSGPAGIFMRLFLNFCLKNKKPIAFPHLISGTSDQVRSYAETKHDEGYRDEMITRVKTVVRVRIFHQRCTKDDEEVIGFSQNFLVTEKKTRGLNNYGRSSEINEFHMKAFDDKSG